MNDFASTLEEHVRDRLEQEKVIWITTVGSDGTPQPNPVWFYWDGECILIYTQPNAAKLKHIARRPRVSLNFEGASVLGGDVVVFNGTALTETGAPEPDPGYVEKYLQVATEEWGRTVEDIYQEFSVLIRVKPEKVRVF